MQSKDVGCNAYFMFSLPLGQIAASFSILNLILNTKQYFKLQYGNTSHVLADNIRKSKHKAESWKLGSATEKRGWTARRGDAVLETRLLESGRTGGLLGTL